MATRVRESGVRGKEKKGSQADNTMPQQHKRTTTTTTSRLMSSSSSVVNSVPNYLRPTTASSAVQAAAGDKPHPPRRKSLDRPLPHLDTHRNLAGDKPSPARRKSFDRPIQPLSSPSSTSVTHNKPTFSRTKSSLDNKPKSSTAISRTSETNDRRGKMMTRSISSLSKSSSSSSIAHNHHSKPVSDRPAMAKTQKNSTRKQPGTTLSSKPVKKKPAETILTTNHHQEPSVPVPESADHHHETEVSANPDSKQTEINNNSSSKIVQEKENIVVVSDHEELEDLKSIEDCSLLSVPEDPPIDPVDTITEEGDAEATSAEISVPENLQESGQTADTIPPTTPEDPQVEVKDGGGESNNTNNLKETTPADPKPADEVSLEEKGDEMTMQPSCHSHSNSSSIDNNCSEDKAEKQEEEEEEEREKEKEKDKKADNHHHQELADEEVKEITDDQNNNNNNNNVVQSPEANKPALKRNESVVSNDVIEETASKLREQRKNKVKALAGAFETVISLQDK